MLSEDSIKAYSRLGMVCSFATFAVLLAYVPVLVLGLLSLKSPTEAIGDPYFSSLEILIVFAAPLMVIVMVAVHNCAPQPVTWRVNSSYEFSYEMVSGDAFLHLGEVALCAGQSTS